jgi:putative tricarboxylic transport membrane protein
MEKMKPYLSMTILLLAVCGVYSFQNSPIDILIMVSAGVLGYLLKNMEFPAAPVILGMLLGEMAEQSLRQSLVISQGSPLIFVQKPMAAIFLALAVVSVFFGAMSVKGKGKVLRSDDAEQ